MEFFLQLLSGPESQIQSVWLIARALVVRILTTWNSSTDRSEISNLEQLFKLFVTVLTALKVLYTT